ncbi:MAG: hypothetical protein KAU62_12915 [Candidatus Heimdallarchaeota archaeon]|nr:hypothetical protein [Candidatus Heimdallarchaeota archaeon]MCK4612053.1 hypothetical protein [Candidatus Heimdallarchaeota archaeon]
MIQLDIRILVPLISILSSGLLIVEIVKKRILKLKTSDSFAENLVESLVVGTIVLVVPMLIIAWFANKTNNILILERFVYVYLAIGLLYLIYKIYVWVRKKLPILVLSGRKRLTQSMDLLLKIVIILMILFYAFQILVYPLKGWDFLHFYLPNSFRIFITGQLSSINELTFFPQFKPPMNILLFAYTFFVTQSEMIQFIPILYLSGTAYFCYKISKIMGLSKKTALFASIAFLATPLTYFLLYEYTYYQEMYILFFTTGAFYYYKRFLGTEKSKEQLYFAILTSLSLGGCSLSKLSGFVIPIVLFVAMPSDKIGKVLRVIIIVGFASQLIRKSIFEIYLGTGILIGLLAIYCIYLVFSSKSLIFSVKRWIYTLGIFAFPFAIIVLWVFYMLTIPGVENYLVDLFVNLKFSNLSLSWPGIALPGTVTYLENAHTASFISSSFSILIAAMFAGTWMIFKLVGFVSSNKKNNDLLLWLIFFFIIWQGFFAMGSVRYLIPILVPLAIIFAVGFESIVEYFNKRDGKDRDGLLAYLFITASAYLFLYPVLPIETVFENFHLRWYFAHTRLLSLFGYILLFNLVTFLLIWKEKNLKLSYSQIYNKKFNVRKILSGTLIFVVVSVPFAGQAALLASVGFNLKNFESTYCYDYRESFQELIDAINRLGYTDNQIILSVNTPGLEYYSSQPIIDLYMIGFLSETGLSDSSVPLWKSNVTRNLEFFEKYGVTIFVALNGSNDWFPAYLEEFYWNYFIFRFLHNNEYFTYRFANEEFMLFTIIKFEDFIGPVDIELKGNSSKSSLLAYAPLSIDITDETASIEALLDLTAIQTNQPISIDISTRYTLSTNSTIIVDNSNFVFNKPINEAFTSLSLMTLPQQLTYIHDISITINYNDLEGFPQTVIHNLDPMFGNSVNITWTGNSWFYEGYYGFQFL